MLTPEQKSFWHNNSYLVFPGLFKAASGEMKAWAEEIAAWPESGDKWMTFYEADNKTLLSRRENLVPFHKGVSEMLMGDTTMRIVSELMGAPACLYKDRVNFKHPGGGPHSAHQDGVAYEKGGDSSFDVTKPPYISILISVDEATEENGCLHVVPEWSLENEKILPMDYPDPDRPAFSKISNLVEDSLPWMAIPTKPGDALFFTERLPHRSASNFSARRRTILYGVYNPLSEGDKRKTYYDSKRVDPNNARYLVGNPHAPSD